MEAEEAIRNGDVDSDDDAIYGMDIKTFEAIIAEDKYDEYEQQYGVKEKFYEKFPIKVATKASTEA